MFGLIRTGQRLKRQLQQLHKQSTKEDKMTVYIDNLNLTAKQLRELRAAIKARYTPEKVKTLNARLKAAKGK